MRTFKRFITETKNPEDHPDYKQAHALRDMFHQHQPENAQRFDHFFDRAMTHGNPTKARDFAKGIMSGDISLKDYEYNEPNDIWAKAEGYKKSRPKAPSSADSETKTSRSQGRPSTKTKQTTSKPTETKQTTSKPTEPKSTTVDSEGVPRKVKVEQPKPQNVEVDPSQIKHIPQGVSGIDTETKFEKKVRSPWSDERRKKTLANRPAEYNIQNRVGPYIKKPKAEPKEKEEIEKRSYRKLSIDPSMTRSDILATYRAPSQAIRYDMEGPRTPIPAKPKPEPERDSIKPSPMVPKFVAQAAKAGVASTPIENTRHSSTIKSDEPTVTLEKRSEYKQIEAKYTGPKWMQAALAARNRNG